MNTTRPTVVSLFAGCGGSSLGYKLAGFDERLAVEWDENAQKTFSANFPAIPLFGGDIAKLSGEEALALARVEEKELDVLDGSPPCQGFSTAGKRNKSDRRNRLFEEYLRLLRSFKPRALVMENVAGLVRGTMVSVFKEIVVGLRESGYSIAASKLNATWFGVPQARERVIFIGFRNDLQVKPMMPRATVTRATTCIEALEGLKIDKEERKMLLEAGAKLKSFLYWDVIKPGQSLQGATRGNFGFNAKKFRSDRPAFTITKTDGLLRRYGAMHWSERRRFTVGEFKRFTSFPDNFVFVGDYADAVARIGNSVPPLMMKAIAESIKEQLELS